MIQPPPQPPIEVGLTIETIRRKCNLHSTCRSVIDFPLRIVLRSHIHYLGNGIDLYNFYTELICNWPIYSGCRVSMVWYRDMLLTMPVVMQLQQHIHTFHRCFRAHLAHFYEVFWSKIFCRILQLCLSPTNGRRRLSKMTVLKVRFKNKKEVL